MCRRAYSRELVLIKRVLFTVHTKMLSTTLLYPYHAIISSIRLFMYKSYSIVLMYTFHCVAIIVVLLYTIFLLVGATNSQIVYKLPIHQYHYSWLYLSHKRGRIFPMIRCFTFCYDPESFLISAASLFEFQNIFLINN